MVNWPSQRLVSTGRKYPLRMMSEIKNIGESCQSKRRMKRTMLAASMSKLQMYHKSMDTAGGQIVNGSMINTVHSG